jgi:hypothetical protein
MPNYPNAGPIYPNSGPAYPNQQPPQGYDRQQVANMLRERAMGAPAPVQPQQVDGGLLGALLRLFGTQETQQTGGVRG